MKLFHLSSGYSLFFGHVVFYRCFNADNDREYIQLLIGKKTTIIEHSFFTETRFDYRFRFLIPIGK